MTQPTFDLGALADLKGYRKRAPIIVGVMILRSLKHAQRIDQVPGISMPETIFAQQSRYTDEEDQAKSCADLAIEQIRWVRDNG